MSLRLLHDWVLVELEPTKEVTSGGIIKVGPDPIRTAKVLRTGPGRRTKKGKLVPLGVEPGDRFPFFKAVTESGVNKAYAEHINEDQTLVRASDILFLLDEDLEVTL